MTVSHAGPLSEAPAPLRKRQTRFRIAVRMRPTIWGWLPFLSLVGAFGLLAVAVANIRWRSSAPLAAELYWLGLLLLYLPVALRMFSPSVMREERVGLVALLGLELFAVKLLGSPASFKGFDELLHWRTANDIINQGRLFTTNPLLPVSPYYPGMEGIVSALNQVAGLSVFPAGVIVTAAARLVFVLALYMFYQRIGRSERLAGCAVLLYMANPSFVYFDALFAYESVALAFAALLLFALARWLYTRTQNPVGTWIVFAISLAAVVVTHHLTTYAVVGILIVWSGVDAIYRRWGPPRQRHLGWAPTVFAVALSGLWLALVAGLTVSYLTAEIGSALREMFDFLLGKSAARGLFSTNVGTKAPIGEQLSGVASVALIIGILPVGLLSIWFRHRRHIPAMVLAVVSLAYPVTQAFRIVHTRADISGRSVEFIFLALAFVLAVGMLDGIARRVVPRVRARSINAILAVAATIMFAGGVAIGWKPLAPGPYLVGATDRAIDVQGIGAAEWAREYLGPDHRVGADRTNGLLMVVYGAQYQVTLSEDGILVPQVFLAPELTPDMQYILREGQLDYLVVDQRLSTALPYVGFYFEQSEPDAFDRTEPICAEALAKFAADDNISLLYDNGVIRIYDVRALVNER